MGERTIGRREMLRGTGVVVTGVAVGGMGMASPALAHDGHDTRHQLTGSWMIQRRDNGTPTWVAAVLSFTAGNVLISHDINPPGPPFTGQWAQHGRSFKGTIWTGQLEGQGPTAPAVTIEVHISGRLDDDMDSMSGSYTFTVRDAKTGAVLPASQGGTGTGTFHGKPIAA